MENLSVLDTQYGVVRYLYLDIFKKARNEANDLQSQTLFLKSLNKYMLCRSGQYVHLYNQYMKLSRDTIQKHFEDNRLKMNFSAYEWLSYTTIVAAPRILPTSVDGPYVIDSLSLRRYTYFYTARHNIKSNILGTPFYCLDGIDHLYYEIQEWQDLCSSFDIKLVINEKHIFHDTFYMVDMSGPNMNTMRFLFWLDDVDIQTELYVINDGDSNSENVVDGGTGGRELCLLKRLYIACDSTYFVQQLSNIEETRDQTKNPYIRVINLLTSNLSKNFIVTFSGKAPKMTKTAILSLTNDSAGCDGVLNFTSISRFGFDNNLNDQIYEIENMSELVTSAIRTPNILIFQEEIRAIQQPTVAQMNRKLKDFLYFLSMGILDKDIYLRMYMLPASDAATFPKSMRKQMNVIYMQRYRKFCIGKYSFDFSPTFFDKTYVFSAKNLVCTVKSIKSVISDIITSPPLLPPCVMLLESSEETITWSRLTQNILYLSNINSVCFLKDFSVQELTSVNNSRNTDNLESLKMIRIVSNVRMREELNFIFTPAEMNRYEINNVCTFQDIDLRCVHVNKSLNFQLYYFVRSSANEVSSTNDESVMFKTFFLRFMNCSETRRQLSFKLYTIFMQLVNLYDADVVI